MSQGRRGDGDAEAPPRAQAQLSFDVSKNFFFCSSLKDAFAIKTGVTAS